MMSSNVMQKGKALIAIPVILCLQSRTAAARLFAGETRLSVQAGSNKVHLEPLGGLPLNLVIPHRDDSSALLSPF